MPQEYISHHPDDLEQHAQALLSAWKSERIFAFYGTLGAGKTTFIQHICKALGVTDLVTSPTFALVHAYTSVAGPVYHFDLYRLRHEAEAFEIGLDEYLDSGYYCLLEWPERVAGFLPPETVHVQLEVTETGDRLIRADYGKN